MYQTYCRISFIEIFHGFLLFSLYFIGGGSIKSSNSDPAIPITTLPPPPEEKIANLSIADEFEGCKKSGNYPTVYDNVSPLSHLISLSFIIRSVS